MATVERPGINPKWERRWKTTKRNGKDWMASADTSNIQKLEEYIQTGAIRNPFDKEGRSRPEVNPPFEKWEVSYLDNCLTTYSHMRAFEFELKGMDGVWDGNLATRAFAASYTAQMRELYLHHQFPNRFDGRIQHMLSMDDLAFTALGIVLGCKEEAFRLARMQLVAYKAGYFSGGKKYYPIFTFILRIFADYLDEPPLELDGEPLVEPVMQALFDVWRAPEPEALIDVCLAACDYHTWRCSNGNAKNFYEFESFNWTQIPIEILLLFKLRQLLGLQNPELDHPLMNTALGKLPEEMPFQPDDLISRVRARMQQDGYDEDRIYKFVCSLSSESASNCV